MTRPTLDDVFLKYAGLRLDANGRIGKHSTSSSHDQESITMQVPTFVRNVFVIGWNLN